MTMVETIKQLARQGVALSQLCKQDETMCNIGRSPMKHSRGAITLRLHQSVILMPTIIILIVLTTLAQPASQQQLCPSNCQCNEQTLETVCKGSISAPAMPYTLNPATKRIIMNHSQLTKFSAIDYIKQVESLNLAHNKLSAIDFISIIENFNLAYMNVSHNNLTELKDSSVTSAVSKFDSSFPSLSNNPDSDELEKFKTFRKKRINIIELTLSHNHLTTLKNLTFLRFAKLQRLDLSHNSLVSFESAALFGLTKLEYLDLRANFLIQVPGQALQGTTRSLIYTGSSSDMRPASPIKYLDLSENALVQLDSDSFMTLGQLRELHLDSCSLQTIDPGAFKETTNLNTLTMNNNNLVDVPTHSFESLGPLKELQINANPLEQLSPYAMRSLYNLEELQIKNGSLQELQPGSLSGLAVLRQLDLSHNTNLTKVYSTLLMDLPRLMYLNLHMSSISSLHADDNLDVRPLTIFDLRGNPLKCDCQLKWLTKWLKRINETVINVKQANILSHSDSQQLVQNLLLDTKLASDLLNVTCMGPPALFGKSVINLPDNKLECIRPTSSLNVHVGFASLFLLVLLMTTVCMVNFCRDDRHFIGIIKENLVQNRISMMLPYTQDLHTNADNFGKKETHIECAEYEPVDYGQTYGPIYTIPSDQYMLHSNSSSQQHTHQL